MHCSGVLNVEHGTLHLKGLYSWNKALYKEN
jgi:hypothetical protein